MQSLLEQTIVARQIHDTYRQLIEASIRILEQTIHGSVARSIKAKAEYLATVAEGMSKKLEVQHVQLLSQLDSGDARDIVKGRTQELSKQNRQLKAQIRDAQEGLNVWRQKHEDNNVAREYFAVTRDTSAMKSKLDELQRA